MEPKSAWPSTGSKIALGVLALFLIGCAYVGWRAYWFYQENLKPMVSAISSGDVFSTDVAKIKPMLKEIGVVPVPKGYALAFGMNMKIMDTGMTMGVMVPKAERDKLALAMKAKQGASVDTEIAAGTDHATVFTLIKTYGPRDLSKSHYVKGGIDDRQVLGNAKVVSRKRVRVEVAGEGVSAWRLELNQNGRAGLQYFVQPTKDVIVLARGPQETFDEKAFTALLAGLEIGGPKRVMKGKAPAMWCGPARVPKPESRLSGAMPVSGCRQD